MDWLFYPLIITISLVVILSFILRARANKKRTQAFERIAGELGMRFDADATEIQPLLSGFDLFQHGQFRRASRLLIGGEGEDELCVFDYRYTVRGGQNTHTRRQVVAAFRALPAELPEFKLRPEHIFHKIGAAFGYQDIDFDLHPRFSKRYLLRGPQEDRIRSLFSDALIETIMELRPLCIEAAGHTLVLYRPDRRVKTDAIAPFIDEARQIQAAILNKKRRGPRYRLT